MRIKELASYLLENKYNNWVKESIVFTPWILSMIPYLLFDPLLNANHRHHQPNAFKQTLPISKNSFQFPIIFTTKLTIIVLLFALTNI